MKKNNGAGLSGDGASLQNLPGGSTPTRTSIDYQAKYIELKKALTALKRGEASPTHLETLGYSPDDFNHAHQYMVSYAFEVKDREAFIKRLELLNVELADTYCLKTLLDWTRRKLETTDDRDLIQQERILGNLLYGIDLCHTYQPRKPWYSKIFKK